VDRVPDDVVLPPRQALVEAQRLLDEGLPFHAHEILEGCGRTHLTANATSGRGWLSWRSG
jgi:hypothetical protein